jgi:hypothetical protein
LSDMSALRRDVSREWRNLPVYASSYWGTRADWYCLPTKCRLFHHVLDSASFIWSKPSKKSLQTENDITFHPNISKMLVKDGILRRKVKAEDKTTLQHVVPASAIPTILNVRTKN